MALTFGFMSSGVLVEKLRCEWNLWHRVLIGLESGIRGGMIMVCVFRVFSLS